MLSICRIRSDHNEDSTLKILRPWLGSVEREYHSINSELRSSNPSRFSDEDSATHWSSLRFDHVIKLKEEALKFARYSWADFIWVFAHFIVVLFTKNSCGAILFKRNSIQHLWHKFILKSLFLQMLYNFYSLLIKHRRIEIKF